MHLLRDGTNLSLAGDVLLSASYAPQDTGAGSLDLRCTNPITYDHRAVSMPLDPWSPEGYRVEQGWVVESW